MNRIPLLAAAALLSAACSGTEPGPLRVTMSLDKSAVAMDDSVRVALTVVNVSAAPVMVYPASAYRPCAFPGFEVFDRDWRQAWEAHYCLASSFVAPAPVPVSLAPGESIVITRWWRPADLYIEGERIRAGLYRVRGAAMTPDRTIHTPLREVIIGG